GNYVNLVVKPEKPAPRVERRSEREVAFRFAPEDHAHARWSGPTSILKSKVSGEGKGYFEYVLKIPASVVAAHPASYFLRLEVASRAGRAKVDWPSRVNPQDYPQTDERKWRSTLAIDFNGVAIHREALEDDPADARGVLSHLARRDPGSHGELCEVE